MLAAPLAHADADALRAAEAAEKDDNHAEAARLFEQAYRSFDATLGANHPDTLASGAGLGRSYLLLSRPDEGLAWSEKVYRARLEHLGERDLKTAESMDAMALAYWLLGRHADQLDMHERALQARLALLGERDGKTLASLNNLVSAYLALGRANDGLQAALRAATLGAQALGERHEFTLDSIYRVGNAYWTLGRDAESLEWQEKALRLRSETLGERHLDTLSSVNALGVAYVAVARIDEARVLLERALTLAQEQYGERHWLTQYAMNNLGHVYMTAESYDKAVEIGEKVFRLRTVQFGPRHPDTLESQANLARIYTAAGRPADALAVVRQALQLRVETLGETHAGTLASMSAVADTYVALDRHADAVDVAERAVALQAERLGDRHADTLESLLILARAYHGSGRGAKAAALSTRYVDGAEWRRSQPGLGADDRRSIFQAHARGYRAFSVYRAQTGANDEGFRLAELGKARTLLESLTAQRAGRSGALPPDEQARLEDLNRQIAAQDQLLARATREDARQHLYAARNALARQHEQLDAQLKAAFPRYAQLSTPRIVDAGAVARLLDKRTVAVSYLLWGKDSVGAWIVDASGQPRFVDLGSAPDLRDSVDLLRLASADQRGLAAALNDQGKRAWRLPDGRLHLAERRFAPPHGATAVEEGDLVRHLSRRLLLPLATVLRERSHWIIAPDGALAQLPFELLELDGRRVLERVDVQYAPSLSVYALARERQREYRGLARPNDLLAVGNPEYLGPHGVGSRAGARKEADGSAMRPSVRALPVASEMQLGQSAGAWPELPGSGREIDAIRRVLPNGSALVRAQASEARLQRMNEKGDLKRYRYLHFAVHGDLYTEDPALSSLVLSQRDLAPGTDGFITAAEWVGYDLRSDLMVLSACDTGLGRNISGEGVMGLPFALFVAGNVNTVLSLWPVIDSVAPVFMQKFYVRLKAGQSPARALTATKREMAANPRTKHPANWASFVLVGGG